MTERPDNRQRTLAALAVLRDGVHADDICGYMSVTDGAAVKELIGTYSKEETSLIKMERIVRQLCAAEKLSSLAEIHPAWILEKLKAESPRIIGIILRFLPSKHVSFVLNNMPPMLRASIPQMVESFAVPTPVLEVIRNRFERGFASMPISRMLENFGFEHIYYLKGHDLEEVIREIGLVELAIALLGIRGRTIHAVLNRLDLKDAKKLKLFMKMMEKVSPELARQARSNVLEMEDKHIGPGMLLMKAGIAAIASAIREKDDEFIRLITQRLSPADGYLLKRAIEEKKARFSPAVAAERHELVLDAVKSLSKEGRIDPSFVQFFPEEVTPAKAMGVEGEETTNTAELLA